MITIIENAILEKLKRQYGEYEIDSFPVDFQQYTFTSPKGCLLLRYEDHKNSTQKTLTAVNTDKSYNFTLFIAVRYAQKHTDCYKFLEEIEQALNGLTILNKRLLVQSEKFEAEINGDLWYTLDLQINLHLTDIHKDLSICSEQIFNTN